MTLMLSDPELILPQDLKPDRSVHLWTIKCSQLKDRADALYSTLSTDECLRAGKFHFAKDRLRFILARGGLRILAGYYLGMEAGEIIFSYNRYGKPSISTQQIHAGSTLEFNVSHSGEYVLIALSQCVPVGIDIEQLHNDIALLEIAQDFFSPAECAELFSQQAADQYLTFFQLWTKKEAYIKGRGKGLSIPLDSFDVSTYPHKHTVMLNLNGVKEVDHNWSIYELPFFKDYAGALAIKYDTCQISSFDLNNIL